MSGIADDYVRTLRLFMRAEEVSQRELAKHLDVSEVHVSQLLNDPGNLTIKTMEHAAAVLYPFVSKWFAKCRDRFFMRALKAIDDAAEKTSS